VAQTARTQRFDFTGRLDAKTVLGDGSVRYTARLTRTGVFDYGDHRELRTADEVFKKQAVDSFKGVAVTIGHRAFVEPSNWSDVAVGHVGDDVHRDGEFLVASLVVKDADALAWIAEQKEDGGVELSMGYTVDLLEEEGEHDGEHYDAVQTNIVGNHAALGPTDWGRAGRAVRLLDGGAYPPNNMATARIDAPSNSNEDALRKDLDTARADADAIRKERDDARKERDAARADADKEKARADRAEGERDAAKADTVKEKERADKAEKSVDEKVTARLELLDSARLVLGADYDAKGKTDRDIRIAAITKLDPDAKFDGKSDDHVMGRFDAAISSAKKDRGALAGVQAVTAPVPTPVAGAGGAPAKSRLDEALEQQAKEREEQSKGGVPKGAMTRK